MNNINKKPINLLIMDIQRFKDLNYYSINSKKQLISIYFIILKYIFINPSFRAIYFYRILNYQFYQKKKISKITLIISYLINDKIHIPYQAKIGGGLIIPHPKCIIIHSNTIIGRNATIQQGVSIAGNVFKREKGRISPIIGDNVLIGAGAKILGPIKIGDNSIIGANAVVIKDIPKNSVAVGVPAKRIKDVKKSFIDLEREFYEELVDE